MRGPVDAEKFRALSLQKNYFIARKQVIEHRFTPSNLCPNSDSPLRTAFSQPDKDDCCPRE